MEVLVLENDELDENRTKAIPLLDEKTTNQTSLDIMTSMYI